jgi:Putative zinc-finger
MNAGHVGLSDLGLYVMGGLDVLRAARVEQHVLECASCAEALAREARLEMAFEQIAVRVARPSTAPSRAPGRPRPTVTLSGGAMAAVALAAAVLLWVGRGAVDRHPAGRSSFDSRSVGAQPVQARRLQDASGSTASLDAMASRDELDGG